jgi:hypothetical protein
VTVDFALVLNAGPSSLKFCGCRWPETRQWQLDAKGQIEGIGTSPRLSLKNRNVFPDLKVTWGTYPNNLGHMDFPGCFRCHDGSHTTGDGKTITQDCSTCHVPLAMDEASPEILKTLGIAEQISRAQKQ